MKAVQEGAMLRYCFESFPSQGVIHGVFTRRGGTSCGPYASLNVGSTVGDDPAHVQANQQAIHRALGISAESVVTARQVHGDRVAVVPPKMGVGLPGHRRPDHERTWPVPDATLCGLCSRFLLRTPAGCCGPGPRWLAGDAQGHGCQGGSGDVRRVWLQSRRAVRGPWPGDRPLLLRSGARGAGSCARGIVGTRRTHLTLAGRWQSPPRSVAGQRAATA